MNLRWLCAIIGLAMFLYGDMGIGQHIADNALTIAGHWQLYAAAVALSITGIVLCAAGLFSLVGREDQAIIPDKIFHRVRA